MNFRTMIMEKYKDALILNLSINLKNLSLWI